MAQPHNMNALGKKVVRGYIVREDTGDMIVFQFNPSERAEDLKATYVAIESPGMVYPEVDYIGQNARSYPITIYLDEFIDTTQNADKTTYVKDTIERLRDLTRPSKTLSIIRRGKKNFCETPTCRFVFGKTVIKCKIPEVKIKHTSFDRKLNTTSATIDIEILEVK